MNSQMGDDIPGQLVSYNSGWRTYAKMSDLTIPTPTKAFIFCDETMCSLNDGYLQLSLNTPGDYADVPANYHGGVNCFTFADGHGEPRKWLGPTLPKMLYGPNASGNYGKAHPPAVATDPDWLWLTNHASSQS